MKISALSDEEVVKVADIINQILPPGEFTRICADYNLIKLHDRKEDVYLIRKEDQFVLDEMVKFGKIHQCKLVLVKIKLGFFTRHCFRIGIESLHFLAPLCQHPLIIPYKQVERFIYGKDVIFTTVYRDNDVIRITDNSLAIIFSENRLALGYAKIIKKQETIHLQNIIDIGLYLRSEKTAF